MERACDGWRQMEGYCATGQSPHWAVVPLEEEQEEDAHSDIFKEVVIHLLKNLRNSVIVGYL